MKNSYDKKSIVFLTGTRADFGKLKSLIKITTDSNLFEVHPYKDPNIGYMKDLDAATLDEFNAYFDKYYAPNNAVLIVAGDIDVSKTKKLIEQYFSEVKSRSIVRLIVLRRF